MARFLFLLTLLFVALAAFAHDAPLEEEDEPRDLLNDDGGLGLDEHDSDDDDNGAKMRDLTATDRWWFFTPRFAPTRLGPPPSRPRCLRCHYNPYESSQWASRRRYTSRRRYASRRRYTSRWRYASRRRYTSRRRYR